MWQTRFRPVRRDCQFDTVGPNREREVVVPVRVSCACGHSVAVSDQLLGKRVKCPKCGKPVEVLSGSRSTAKANTKTNTNTKTASAASSIERGMSDLLNEVGFDKSRTANSCPNCKTQLEPESVLCVDCGYNLETGRIIKTRKIEKDPYGLKAGTSPGPSGPWRFALPGAALGVGILVAAVLSFVPAASFEAMGLERGHAELVATYAKFVALGAGLVVALALTQQGRPKGKK